MEIDNVAREYSCWQRFGSNLCGKAPTSDEPEAVSVGWGKGIDQAGVAAALGNDLGWRWFKDPRLDCLGFRGIFPANSTRKDAENNTLSHTVKYKIYENANKDLLLVVYLFIFIYIYFIHAAPLVEADKEVNEQHYLLWRLQKGVPEGSTEIPKGLAGFSVNESVIRTCRSL